MRFISRAAALRNIAAASFASLFVIAILALPLRARAQTGTYVSYTTGTYTQDFNSLPAQTPSPDISGSSTFAFGDPTIDASDMGGWYGQSVNDDSFFAGTGSSPSQGFYSFSTSPVSGNNALGLIANSISGNETFGLLLVNSTQSTIFTTLDISFIGELWRYGGVPNSTAIMTFGYQESIDPQAPLPASGGINTDGNLAFSYTNPNSTSGPVNGTLPANQTSLSDVITLATPWAPGESLWLTWTSGTPVNFSPALAIDNFSFAASGNTAASLNWTAASDSIWDTSSSNWTGGTFSNGSFVTFGDPPVSGSDVTITGGGVDPGRVAVTNNIGTYTFSGGPITGSGFITKSGSGALVLSSSNSYSGGTVITGGTLAADGGDNSLGSAGGEIVFGGGQLETLDAGIVSLRNFVADTGGGSFNSNGFNSSTSGSLTGSGPFAKIGSGDLSIGGGVGVVNSQNPILSVQGGSLTLNQAGPQYFTVSTGSGAFAGALVLGAGTRAEVAGSTNSAAPALIDGQGGSILFSGNNAEIDDAGSNSISAGYLEINTNILLNSGSAAGSFTASIGTTTGTFAGTLTIDGTISGSSSLTFTGPNGDRGIVLLNAPSTYTGNTTISNGANGVVRLGVDNGLPVTTQLTFGSNSSSSAAFDLAGFNQTVAGLSTSTSATPGITNTGLSASTLTVNQSIDASYNGTISNNINFIKQGAATLQITSAATLTYSGSTQVNGGTLIVDGAITGSSGVAVGTSGTLAGANGEIIVPNGGQVIVGSGATIAPGDSYANGGNYNPTSTLYIVDNSPTPSTYSANGTFDLLAGGNLSISLGAGAGTNSQLWLEGNVSLAGNLSISLLDGFTANPGDLFFIILNDEGGTTNGYFSDATSTDPNSPSIINVPGPDGPLSFEVSYQGNSSDGPNGSFYDPSAPGSDVVLEYLGVIPEPGTFPMCLGGIGMLLALKRRRRW